MCTFSASTTDIAIDYVAPVIESRHAVEFRPDSDGPGPANIAVHRFDVRFAVEEHADVRSARLGAASLPDNVGNALG